VTAFNSLGLARVGITRLTPERVSNVTIEKDAEGRPTGILSGPVTFYYVDDPYWLQIVGRLPQPDEATWAAIWAEAARLGMKNANRLGKTAGYECHAMDLVHIQSWQKLRDSGELTFRVMAVLEVVNWVLHPGLDATPEYVRAQLDLAKSLTQTTDDIMRVNGATVGRGGIVETGGFRLYEPYEDPFGNPTRGTAGLPRWVEEMTIDYCAKNDLRMNVGVYSYVDHDEFLESLAPYVEKYDIKSRNWVAQHCMVISEAQAKRYAELGFDLTQGSGFVWGMGDVVRERIGDHILKDFTPMRRLFDLGVNVSACVDWGPPSVFKQMELAETHEFARSGHRNTLPGHAVTREQALACFTRNPARLMHWQGIGSLLPGYHADVAIVDRNPATCALDDLGDTKVLRTIVGGRTVHDDGTLRKED
jgi:predicted amidohydrolase YtcJ